MTLPNGVFAKLSSLGALFLFTNSLTTLPAGIFDGLSSLGWFDLNDNSLTTLPDGIFARLSSLSSLDLGGNSLGDACYTDPNPWFSDGTNTINRPTTYFCN